jgi:hypothetical protein
MKQRFDLAIHPGGYLALVGAVLVAVAVTLALTGKEATAASLAVFGGGALVVAPFAARLRGALKIGPVEMNLQEQAVRAVRSAPPDTLEGVLPLLEGEGVSVARLDLPDDLAHSSLTSGAFKFLRPNLHISVIAVRIPGEAGWRAGGGISDLPLPPGTELLVTGPPASLEAFRRGDRTAELPVDRPVGGATDASG